jgi:Tfp pilus assembly protein PilF
VSEVFVSRLFDSLQRARRREPEEDHYAQSHRAAQADAVLETLGYRKRRPNSYRKPIFFAVIGIVAAIAVAWILWPKAGVRRRPAETVANPASQSPPPVAVNPSPTRPPAPAPPATSAPPPPALPSVQARPKAVAGPVSTPPPVVRTPRRPVPEPQPAAGATGGTVTPPATEAGVPPSAEVFRQAVYFHRAGDYDNARTRYMALLARNELDPRVHNNLGLLYRDRGMLDDAVREFQRALIVNPHYLTARTNLGVALLGQSRLDEAAAEFNRALSQDARNVDAIVNLALVEKAAGRSERAKELLLRALVLDSHNAPAHFNLAALYEASGEEARAVDHYRAFLENAGEDHAARTADARARLEALERAR